MCAILPTRCNCSSSLFRTSPPSPRSYISPTHKKCIQLSSSSEELYLPHTIPKHSSLSSLRLSLSPDPPDLEYRSICNREKLFDRKCGKRKGVKISGTFDKIQRHRFCRSKGPLFITFQSKHAHNHTNSFRGGSGPLKFWDLSPDSHSLTRDESTK